MYTRILTPLDGSGVSEQALHYARSLAASLSLPITLLYAIEQQIPALPRALNFSFNFQEVAANRIRQAESYVESIAAELRNDGLSVNAETPQGEPSAAIVEEAAKDSGTLITMSSHGRSGLSRWWMGSITDKVLQSTGNPLLVIHGGSEQYEAPPETQKGAPLDRITVPVDGSELAEDILPHATYLSAAMGLTIDLIQVNPSRDEYYRSMSIAPNEVSRVTPSYEDYIQIANADTESYLAELKNRLTQRGGAVETHLLHGAPADCITDLAAATANNLVAMTTHGRSGLGRLVLGSVAERVARQSGGPVLMVRGGQNEQASLTAAPAVA